MPEPQNGITLLDTLNALLGGAGASIVAAILGRAIYHGDEARKGRRRLCGWHLIWEIPIAVTMAIIAESVASFLEASPQVTIGIVAALSYLGPNGFQELLERFLRDHNKR